MRPSSCCLRFIWLRSADVATRYAAPEIIYEFNAAGLLEEPVRTIAHGLLLQSKALNLDLLQLAVLLMAFFPDCAVADAARTVVDAGSVGRALSGRAPV